METTKSSPATSLRILRLGDNWVYSVTGTLTPKGGEPLALTGQIAVSIVPDRLLGRSDAIAILFSQQFQVAQPDGSKKGMPAPDWIFSIVQDEASRDVAIAADNMTPGGTPRKAKAPQIFYPGSWSTKTAYRNRLDFDNGDTVDNTLEVFDQEQVETESGSFFCWKSTVSSQSAATGLIEGMDWWAPELGAPAKFSTKSKMPDGSQMRFTATLRDANLQ